MGEHNPFLDPAAQRALFALMILKRKTALEAVNGVLEGSDTRAKMRVLNRALKLDACFNAEWVRVCKSLGNIAWSAEEFTAHKAYMDQAEPAFLAAICFVIWAI